MTKQEFYKLSKKTAALKILSDSLQAAQLFRYSFFVDNSDAGLDCVYAEMTRNKHQAEAQSTKQKLLAIAKLATDIAEELDE